jgi:hypothetical protein
MDRTAGPKMQRRETFRLRRFLSMLGPGLITGASDDDPSGIGTYSQAGAQLGFGIGWTMLLTYPLMTAIQEISARIGRVTGHGIAGNVCRNFGPVYVWSLVILLFVANTINIAADLGAWPMQPSCSSADRASCMWLCSAAFRCLHRSSLTTIAMSPCSDGLR